MTAKYDTVLWPRWLVPDDGCAMCRMPGCNKPRAEFTYYCPHHYELLGYHILIRPEHARMAKDAGWRRDELYPLALRLADDCNRLLTVSSNAAAILYPDGIIRLVYRYNGNLPKSLYHAAVNEGVVLGFGEGGSQGVPISV